MDASSVIFQLLIILVFARVFGEILAYFGAPPVIGELVAGIVIGPSIFGWVEMNAVIKIMGEIGVILLLFDVGLETDLQKLAKTGIKSVVVAIGGFFAPFALGFALSYWWFELPLLSALFVGGALTATSIGITIRVLGDMNRLNSTEGQITLGAAVLDDILGVILLAVLFDFSTKGQIDWLNTLTILAFVSIFFLIAPIIAKIFARQIQKLDSRVNYPGLKPTTVVALVLFFAWLAHFFGAPELLGGFAAGIALSRRFFLPFGAALHNEKEFAQKIEVQIRPIVQLFTPIFFVSVGLSLDLGQIDWQSSFFWYFSLALLVVAIVTKFTGAMLIKEPWERKVVIGMSMVPRGEVGLIFTGLGASAAVFSDEVYTALVMVIVYTTVLSPFWIKLYYKYKGDKLES
ncbi:cation:proton antiporter [Pseudomonas sp. HK3]|jgi:Kef-type K+ transport system membrane component KefB